MDSLLIAREAKKIKQAAATHKKQPTQLAPSASDKSHEQQSEQVAKDRQRQEEDTQPLSLPGRRAKPFTCSDKEDEDREEGSADRDEGDISCGGQTPTKEEDIDRTEPDSELIVEEVLAALTCHFSTIARSVEHCKKALTSVYRYAVFLRFASQFVEHVQSYDDLCRCSERLRRVERWPQTR